VPVANDVRVGSGGAAKAALSASGSLVYLTGNTQNQLSLVGSGTVARTLTETGAFSFPRFSPDGRRIAVTVGGSMLDIWIYDLATNTLRRLTTEGTNEREEWTPDGRRILFRSERGHGSELWWQAADGSSPAERIVSLDQDVREGVISPDGHTLLYRVDAPKTQGDLWMVSLDGDRTPRPYVATPFIEQAPRFSPDGRWVAYESNESGAFQVYVRAFPGPGSVVQISTAGGLEPVWSRDGHRLAYRDGAQLIETTLSTAGAVAVTARRVVYEGDVATALVHANYDVAPDGAHYLVPAAMAGADRTIVVNDWRYELRARTGAKE
jgi:serine/threonine-protein kinase